MKKQENMVKEVVISVLTLMLILSWIFILHLKSEDELTYCQQLDYLIDTAGKIPLNNTFTTNTSLGHYIELYVYLADRCEIENKDEYQRIMTNELQ